MNSRVFLCVGGQDVTGPFNEADLRLAVADQQVAKTTLACAEGTEVWQPLSELCPQLFESAGSAASQQPPPWMAFPGIPGRGAPPTSAAGVGRAPSVGEARGQQKPEERRTAEFLPPPTAFASGPPATSEAVMPLPRKKRGYLLVVLLIGVASVAAVSAFTVFGLPKALQPESPPPATPTPTPMVQEAAKAGDVPAGGAAEQSAPSITVDGVTYENPLIVKEYPRSIYIRHDQGQTFVEKSKLSAEVIAGLPRAGATGPSPSPAGP